MSNLQSMVHPAETEELVASLIVWVVWGPLAGVRVRVTVKHLSVSVLAVVLTSTTKTMFPAVMLLFATPGPEVKVTLLVGQFPVAVRVEPAFENPLSMAVRLLVTDK